MTRDAPPLDLLVAGGLTIDRFPDGSSAPGGSVLHITRAAAPRDVRLGVVTAAGPEPEAQQGVEELRRATTWLECAEAPATTAFRHRESAAGRRLWLERTSGALDLPAEARAGRSAQAVLMAPIAGEIDADDLRGWDRTWARGAILQGWLRAAGEGEVRALPLKEIDTELVERLSGFDLLVASREDLLAEAGVPLDQLQALRLRFGDRPTLVVTDGVDGVWIQAPTASSQAERWHLPVPWRVDDVGSVGSGDIFAAFMLVGKWQRPPSRAFISERAQAAMQVVAEVLEARRPDRA
jgi:sugar/nucleoside kinase (ribokinase family)